MTWTTISNAAVAVGGIPSSSLMTALRDNPGAMGAAENGAPIVFAGWHPHDKVTVGDGADGLLYDFAIDGALNQVVTPDFVDGYEYRIFGKNITGVTLVIDLYGETEASYKNAVTATASGATDFDCEILTPRIAAKWHAVKFLGRAATTLFNEKDNLSTAQIKSGDNKILKARVRSVGGINNFSGGKIWMFRRREYASLP
jgi:hypothetical protein